MSLCTRCKQMIHPELCIAFDEKDPKNVKCVFCHKELTQITIQKEDGKEYIVTKDMAVQAYKEYLIKLKSSDRIAKVLVNAADIKNNQRS